MSTNGGPLGKEDQTPAEELGAALAARHEKRQRGTSPALATPHPADDLSGERKKGEKLEEWMLTYMDTVTLLVTLFVLLLSFSSLEKEKFDAMAQGLDLRKYGLGLMQGDLGILDRPTPSVALVPDGLDVPPALNRVTTPEKAPSENGLQQLLAEQGLNDTVDLSITDELVDLRLREAVLFESGEARLLETGEAVLARLTPLLNRGAFPISVEGHTDNVPIATEFFPSNWELSGSRAAAVVRSLVDLGVTESRLQVVGHAHTKPVADNGSADGRQKNRRVSLILHIAPDEADKVLRNQE